ncbi:hypothetical protein Cfla_1111 [Cellulomonas flavigena DSM 20109]|uniref:Uncharacterized protein n=1 Tax=Cellulomonas flavigena (strain ATCC 482 / DSM 20109 / BCRC 11376 / JCM 18109 / NBRC 3775 / NCIMB 8073 / NRS 134) TaxID=446466 RepID=D5ULH3_CELFN|nr:hypothetical protein [Cellulomonas flavigena]ADG74015.1 hypothetical protein Cfla_1111 [Cellulomonas flavigena DSM 20109]
MSGTTAGELPGAAAPGGPDGPAAARRHRLRLPDRRTLGAGVGVLAALAVGHVVVTAFPVSDRVQASFLRPAEVGEPVELRYARLTAGTPAGSTVLAPQGGTLLATPGVWLTVPLTIEVVGQPRALGFAELRGGDGRTYAVFTGGRSVFLPGTAQPGVPRHATVQVEVPPAAVPGAHLRIGLDGRDQRHDDVADIDLGLTQADADAWADDDTPLVVQAPTDGPQERS